MYMGRIYIQKYKQYGFFDPVKIRENSQLSVKTVTDFSGHMGLNNNAFW